MNRLSIITVNYNNAEGLKATLRSVKEQTYYGFEHIIIDGGSSDGSVEVIKSYTEYYESFVISNLSIRPVVSWVSERDGGIYDAMNKGVRKASGDYLYFLNSGDTLASPTILGEMIHQLDGIGFVLGRVFFTRGGIVESQSSLLTERDMSMYRMYLNGINHQSAFIRRDLLMKTPYDTSVKMGADWKFFVQSIVINGVAVKFMDIFIANFDLSGLSSDTQAIKREREAIIETILPKRIACDYLAIAPHYYEVIRIKWLLCHPFWYKVFRAWTTLGRKMCFHDRKPVND